MQQQADPLVLALQAQRNRALDELALAQAQLLMARQKIGDMEAAMAADAAAPDPRPGAPETTAAPPPAKPRPGKRAKPRARKRSALPLATVET